jgi:Ca-activated chloride channel family protein
MKYRYTKYVEELLDGLDMEGLVSRLSDLLLSSGFGNPWDPQSDSDQSMQALHDAVLDALLNGGVMSDEMLQKLMREPSDEDARARIEDMVQKIIEQLTEQGFVSTTGTPPSGQPAAGAVGEAADSGAATRFEVTDKARDFLG